MFSERERGTECCRLVGKPGGLTPNVIRTIGWRVMKMFGYVGNNINNSNVINDNIEF